MIESGGQTHAGLSALAAECILWGVRWLVIAFLCLVGNGCATEERRANSFEFGYSYLASDLEVPEVCEKISPRAYLGAGVFSPNRFKSSYTRSDCYEHLALATNDFSHCDQVAPRSRFPFGSINDPERCREKVAQGYGLESHGGNFDLLMDHMGFPEDVSIRSRSSCFRYPAPDYNWRRPHDIRNRVRFLPDFSQEDPDIEALREQARTHDLAYRKAHVNDLVNGSRSLGMAALKGDLECVEHLLALGADPSLRDEAGHTALHEAASRGHTDVIRRLLATGQSLDSRARDGGTPLHDAAGAGRIGAVDVLLEAGADLEARDRWGHTPVQLATQRGQWEMRQYLIDRGAEPLWTDF